MSPDTPHQDSGPEPARPATDSPDGPVADMILNLRFVPTWARQPADESPTAAEAAPASEAEDLPPEGRVERQRPKRDRNMRRREERAEPANAERQPVKRQPAARLPVFISFLPERSALDRVGRRIQAARKAYPLEQLSVWFLTKPEHFLIKVESRGDLTLYQFKPDGCIFTDEDSLRSHALTTHLREVFEEVIEQGDPPSGQFTCVGRCTLTGELLGPPNYHGFQERLLELQRTRFPHLKIDEYRAKIELVKDPAAIEQWKEQARTRRRYRPKNAPPDAPLLSSEEAILEYERTQLGQLRSAGKRFIMPARMLEKLPEHYPLRRQIEEALRRERAKPFTMTLALRPALRHKGLHFFKAREGETFVTAVEPHPIDPANTAAHIRPLLEAIRNYPGLKRDDLLPILKPGADPLSEAAIRLFSDLRWLVEKGFVIEFFDGSLTAPSPTEKPAPERPPREPRQNQPSNISPPG
ncbi:MAG: hypothetical protein NZ740_09110 [Kiritimatiellae bacterium]|nr:hypothetical protein [Kiritimatiellia bacterium]MDW8459251.1 hypothetical protein [Verrucomicrobiota bacterium]